MTPEEFKQYSKMSDADLLDFVTETQGSQRGHLARHLLSMRQHTTMKTATVFAAVAAVASAFGAIAQAAVALIAYLASQPPPH